jgi:hypothetical protein
MKSSPAEPDMPETSFSNFNNVHPQCFLTAIKASMPLAFRPMGIEI